MAFSASPRRSWHLKTSKRALRGSSSAKMRPLKAPAGHVSTQLVHLPQRLSIG
jgi:hypothetical protein